LVKIGPQYRARYVKTPSTFCVVDSSAEGAESRVAMATVVTRTRSSVTLHVLYLPLFSSKSSLVILEAVKRKCMYMRCGLWFSFVIKCLILYF